MADGRPDTSSGSGPGESHLHPPPAPSRVDPAGNRASSPCLCGTDLSQFRRAAAHGGAGDAGNGYGNLGSDVTGILSPPSGSGRAVELDDFGSQGRPPLPLRRQGGIGHRPARPLCEAVRRGAGAIDTEIPEAPRKLRAYTELYLDVLTNRRMCLCGMLAAEFQTLPAPMQGVVIQFSTTTRRGLPESSTRGVKPAHFASPARVTKWPASSSPRSRVPCSSRCPSATSLGFRPRRRV